MINNISKLYFPTISLLLSSTRFKPLTTWPYPLEDKWSTNLYHTIFLIYFLVIFILTSSSRFTFDNLAILLKRLLMPLFTNLCHITFENYIFLKYSSYIKPKIQTFDDWSCHPSWKCSTNIILLTLLIFSFYFRFNFVPSLYSDI